MGGGEKDTIIILQNITARRKTDYIPSIFGYTYLNVLSGSYGTYAYMQSSKTVEDNVSLTMGTLDVVSYWDSEWEATSAVTEATKTGEGNVVKDVLTVAKTNGGHFMYITVEVTITDDIIGNEAVVDNVFKADAARFLTVESAQVVEAK